MVIRTELGGQEFERLAEFLYRHTGVRLPAHKRLMVQSRLLRRLRDLKLEDFSPYLDVVQANPVERQLVIDLLTTHETFFFREPEHFRLLGQDSRVRKHPVRVWSAACSTGEEPYSVAMTLADSAGNGYKVLGTDVSLSSLERARKAVYPLAASHKIPPKFLKSYCLKGTGPQIGSLRIAREITGNVEFKQLSLLTPAGDNHSFHYIFLRNVLIYFDARSRQAALQSAFNSLLPGGLLFLGTAESLRFDSFRMTSIQAGVYKKE